MGESGLSRTLEELRDAELLVPVRSSGGQELKAADVPLEEMRHGTDQDGRFLAAYTDTALLRAYGPPGSDTLRVSGSRLFRLAAEAGERIVIDPGAPDQHELPAALVAQSAGVASEPGPAARTPAVAAGGFRPTPPLPELARAGEIPGPLAAALRGALAALPQVERAWLLRRGEGWTIGIQQAPEATLADFDDVRNRLHAVATEQLGTRRLLAVTDLRAPALREQYARLDAPFYERGRRRGLLARLFGG